MWDEHERVCGARTSLLSYGRLLAAAFSLLFNAKLRGQRPREGAQAGRGACVERTSRGADREKRLVARQIIGLVLVKAAAAGTDAC